MEFILFSYKQEKSVSNQKKQFARCISKVHLNKGYMFCLIPLVSVQYVLPVNSMDFVASILILINRQYHEFSEGKYTNLFPEGI